MNEGKGRDPRDNLIQSPAQPMETLSRPERPSEVPKVAQPVCDITNTKTCVPHSLSSCWRLEGLQGVSFTFLCR